MPQDTISPKSLIRTLLFVAICHTRLAAQERLPVVPTPRRVEWIGDGFRIDKSTRLVVSPKATAEELFATAELRQAIVESLKLTLSVDSDIDPRKAANTIVLGYPASHPLVASRMESHELRLDDQMREQGYVLGISQEGAVLGAATGRGMLYAVMTLRQMLLDAGPEKPLPGIRIRDWPHMKMRGIQDETSYGQVSTMQNFKDLVRFLARYKMNTMFIYLEDTFRFRHYPTIGIGRGAFTREQIDELEAYAKPYHVQIIPIFEMLGNQGALLMLDAVRPFAEYPGAHSFSISEPTDRFLENCFEELADVFDSPYFHAGLDESWDLGFGKTEPLVNEQGRGPVHAAHYRRLQEMFRRRGKTMIMYADIILNRPEILDLIPQDIVLMDWQYHPADRYPTVTKLAQHGFPLMVLPGMNNWDRIFPTMSRAEINIRNFTLEGIRHNAIGSFTSTWGDNGSKNLRELLYYGYAYGAEVTWSPESTELGSFGERFFDLHNGAGTAPYFGAIYALLEKWPWWYPLLDYFRHPFLPPKDDTPHAEQDLHRVSEDARVALQLMQAAKPRVVRRTGDLDYLEYCARMHRHYVRSQRLVNALQGFEPSEVGEAEKRPPQQEFLREIAAVRNETVSLRNLFHELWLRTNLPANLHYAMDDYDQLVKVWDDTAQRVSKGVFAYDARPPANWIYHPDGIRGDREVQHAFFRHAFEAEPDKLARANIQVHGDTHVKVFVNGQLLGEQFARRNLSAPVNPQLVRLYDVLPHLQAGTNVIAIEARNYGTMNQNLDPGGPARCGGFHLYGELVAADSEVQVLSSDEGWRVNDKPVENWNGRQFDDSDWPTAKRDSEPTVWVTYPDFVENIRGFSDVR